MAFLLKNNSISSHLRSSSQKMEGGALAQPRRGFHVELGSREKDLLAENDALRRFKSHKKGVRQLKRIGDVITAVVVAAFLMCDVFHSGCCYEIYARATMKKEA
ncbi:hypothetical protein YC2023_041771 [Brassica napus]